jgi:serine/threonine protein kinase
MVRPLGRGGMGEVYIARTRRADRPVVAVKRLRPDVARVPTFAERFEHEAQLAVRLAHPNVVATIDVGTVGAQMYVAAELVLGKDTGVIADRLRERGQGAPVAVVIRVLLDVLQGLAYVHSARERDGRWLALVHRDVTPGNVLVSYEGAARLADFGLAKSQLTDRSNLTSHGEILGTPHYMAPELVRGAKASPSSDLYGLGAVMYRILTGLAPFTGSTTEVLMKVLNERPRPLVEWRPDLPPWFASIVHELLDPDPKRRPFDAGLLARRLEHEAETARLLLPHQSVGRWLSQLFEEEKTREIDEYEAIAALSPPATDPDDDTRVLAALEVGRGLEGGSALGQGDDVGTELELSSAMFADLSREARRIGTSTTRGDGVDDPAERRLPEWRETVGVAEGTPRTPIPPTTDRDENEGEATREASRETTTPSPGDPRRPHGRGRRGAGADAAGVRRPPHAPGDRADRDVVPRRGGDRYGGHRSRAQEDPRGHRPGRPHGGPHARRGDVAATSRRRSWARRVSAPRGRRSGLSRGPAAARGHAAPGAGGAAGRHGAVVAQPGLGRARATPATGRATTRRGARHGHPGRAPRAPAPR